MITKMVCTVHYILSPLKSRIIGMGLGLLFLTFLIGLTWIFGFLLYSQSIVTLIFTICNDLQGFVIFIERCTSEKDKNFTKGFVQIPCKCLSIYTLI